MNDYKMEVYRGPKVKKKGTRCYDLEKVLALGRKLFASDRLVTRITFSLSKKDFVITLKRNYKRTKYPDIKIPMLLRTKY